MTPQEVYYWSRFDYAQSNEYPELGPGLIVAFSGVTLKDVRLDFGSPQAKGGRIWLPRAECTPIESRNLSLIHLS
jgi:hypothetical protein